MKKIAITGNLGTGKTTILKILQDLGFSTFSCDEAVKELYEDLDVKEEIVKIFGKEILETEGGINKKMILEKILKDQELKKRLENILHPLVKEKFLEFIKENKKEKVIFAEVPLLFEVGWESLFDEIWVVSCSEKTQKERIAKKGLEENIGSEILKFQLPLREKEKRAHKIVFSEKDIKELKEEIKEMLKEYLKD
ncbi:MAG: Dephospho-CoA kinase [Thermodesulfobacterium sp.]|uniref:Dephospho-CoA kinase n=1 Tax=Candidatus Thermodesulfobacterium syntrophicum TaxID=3060442 RepID=A0AAE3P534_9BACT|nr:Dephospho-CoA kinase [Candidatus Thermodesulfobacterium syntrophicum]